MICWFSLGNDRCRKVRIRNLAELPDNASSMHLTRQVAGNAVGDRQAGAPLVEAERRAGIHLETHMAAFRRAPQVDAGERKAEALGELRCSSARTCASSSHATISGSTPVSRAA